MQNDDRSGACYARGVRLGLVFSLLALGACRDDGPPAAPDTGVVEWVIDGDTIDVTINGTDERIRLLGIDTPETKVPNTPAECFGPEAAARTAELLPVGTEVRLERDIVARDDYGRLLAYVYRLSDDLLINEALVRDGYARPLWIEPNGALHGRVVDAARAAEAADVGLWAACGG